jgi:hypothetical protein
MTVSRPLALITGASSGLGAEFARQLAARGYDLILVARRKDRLEALARELRSRHGVEARYLAADLTNDADLKVVEDYITGARNLQLLVNNAGFGTVGRFYEAELARQDAMHKLHVLATLRLTHAALRKMTASQFASSPDDLSRRSREPGPASAGTDQGAGAPPPSSSGQAAEPLPAQGRGPARRNGGQGRAAGGAVINVSSLAAFAPRPGSTSYYATKAWMNCFTEGLHLELRSQRSPVRVQALCPGFTYTEFHDVMRVERSAVPGWMWMSARKVVRASLEGLARGKLIVVPGWQYRFFYLLLRLLPRSLLNFFAIRNPMRWER